MRRFKVKVNDEVFEVEVEEVGKTETVRSVRPVVPAPQPVNLPSPAPRVTPHAPAAPVVAAPAIRPSAPKEPEAAGQGDENAVRAPIPGVVSEVKVAAGAHVNKGDVLLLLEAMKMQNEILAPFDALVTEVPANQGASVQTGDVLVRLQR